MISPRFTIRIYFPQAPGIAGMPICEICGMEVSEVKECKECESKFCEECGDEKNSLCYDCQGWTDDPDDDWEEDSLN